jgi:diaminopimelate decarboxylase
LRVLRSEGASVHANTPGDAYCAMRAGFERERVVLSGSNLGEEDLSYLDREGVYVNVDSMDDLARACSILRSREVGLRLHLEGVLPESRMGLREHELAGAMELARSRGFRITSLHVYCGTHGRCLDRYRLALARLVDLGSRMPDVVCLNVGGGFGYDYHEPEQHPFPFGALAAIAGAACKELSAVRGRPVLLRVEPGRAAVAGAGVLLTCVRSVKRGASRRYVGVDTTTASFTSPVVHGSHRRVVAVEAREPDALPADVCGCTTYSRDFVAQGSPLDAVQIGDLLAVLDVGAYGYCMSSHFLNRPKPPEVFVEAGEARLVTRRQTFEDLTASQIDAQG